MGLPFFGRHNTFINHNVLTQEQREALGGGMQMMRGMMGPGRSETMGPGMRR